jgi:hypothetical protein
MRHFRVTKVITEQELPKFVKGLVQGRADVCIAVAFWGEDAITRLGLDQAAGGRILCNPLLGYCDPNVIKELGKSFEVFAHPKLHAKVYMTTERATVGSSNASSNGLVQDFDGTTSGLRELNLGSDDPATLKQLNDWFEARWKEKIEITSDMFRPSPTGLLVPPRPGSLIQALWQRPDYFRALPIYLMLYKQFVDKGTRAQIKSEVRKLKVGNLALERVGAATSEPHGGSKTKLESLLGTYSEYVGWGNAFPRHDAWLIDISRVRKAKFWGIFQSYSNVRLPTRTEADLAFKRPCINVAGLSFQLTEEDKQLLQDRFDDLWNHHDAKGEEAGRVLAFHAASDVLFASH